MPDSTHIPQLRSGTKLSSVLRRRRLSGALFVLFFLSVTTPPFATAQVGHLQASATQVLQGSVVDQTGKPVFGAIVRLEQTGQPERTAKSDARGIFALATSGPGNYACTAEKGDRRSAVITVAVDSDRGLLPIQLVIASPVSSTPSDTTGQAMGFADQPNFSIAGVTDWTAAGGHGSDTSLRTSEALTRATLTLQPQGGSAGASVTFKDKAEILQVRDRVLEQLTHEDNADLHRLLGELDERLGDPLGAVHEEERAVRLDPSEQNYFEWGSELLLHRAVWQAAEVFQNGTKSYPHSARMLAALGTALFASARYDEAALQLCAASDLEPGNPEPYLFIGKIELAAPSPLPCVEQKLARFAQQQPDNSQANYLYAMAIWRRQQQPADPKDMEQVESLLHKAVTLDAKCGEAYLQLGLIAFSEHDYEKAIGLYTSAIRADPKLGEAHYRLGVAYDRSGHAAKARAEFQIHDAIETAQAEAIERERREVKQFLVVLQGQLAPPTH